MKEYSQKISVVALRDIPSDSTWTDAALLAVVHSYHGAPFNLDPQPVEGTGGECYSLNMEHIIDMTDTAPFDNPTSAIVLYKLSGRSEYVTIGTRVLPATVQIVKKLNHCILKVSCSMLKSPF